MSDADVIRTSGVPAGAIPPSASLTPPPSGALTPAPAGRPPVALSQAIADLNLPIAAPDPGALPAEPRVFNLVRYDDVSGISGTGIVAQGVQFRDGQVAVQWCCPGLPRSCAVWDSLEDMLVIHGHRGRTVVKWADGRD